MSKLVTPMDVAMAGLGLWRRQAQSAAIMGMRLSGYGAAWMVPPSAALDLVARQQAEFARATHRVSRALLEQVSPREGGAGPRDGRG